MTDWYPMGKRLQCRDLWVTVPLDWEHPDGETIRVFAREVIDPQFLTAETPVLLYLQGGPGGKSPRPIGDAGFVGAAAQRFRVVLLDQRGTGRSTPVRGADFLELSPEAAGRRLSMYRADSIVRDCEVLRSVHFGRKPWWTLGQSYGGFLTLQYLSYAPEAIVAAAVTGGIPGLETDAAAVYARTLPRVLAKNREFQARLPHLQTRISRVADLVSATSVMLPDGSQLSVERLQTLGMSFGVSTGYDAVHSLFDEAFVDSDETQLSDAFLHGVANATGYAMNPLYIALQESIYGPGPSRWAAQQEISQHPDFMTTARPLLFTGEMVFPWMCEQLPGLRDFRAGIEWLAEHGAPMEWYDTDRLMQNEAPLEAAVYFGDMYVDAELSLETIAKIGNAHAWVTNEFEHDGLRQGNVSDRLLAALELRLSSKTPDPNIN